MIQDNLEQVMGIPGLEDQDHRMKRAPAQQLPFGSAPEGFVDEVVWVEGESYTGLGYCDDEDDEDYYIVYPREVLRGAYLSVHESIMRLATKKEVESWFGLLAKEKSGAPSQKIPQ